MINGKLNSSKFDSQRLANNEDFNRTFESLKQDQKFSGTMEFKQNEDIDIENV